jgi:Fe-S oxidoreductase
MTVENRGNGMSIALPMATVENCRYCLMCRHNCPVEHVTRRETLSPHGWALLIASQQRGLVDWNGETVDILYQCCQCGNCRSHCVTDQPLPEAIAAARTELVRQQLAPPAVYALDEQLRQWGNPYASQRPEGVTSQGEVALFVGDEAHYLWPEAVTAALQLLKAIGISPVLIGVGQNSGYLPSSLGLQETALNLAQANLADLQASGASRLLVLTAVDAFTFVQLYPEHFGLTAPVELVEVIPLLAAEAAKGSLTFEAAVPPAAPAYVDPFYAARFPGRHAAPRSLLARIYGTAGVELFFREERTHPSGNTPLHFTHPALNEQLIRARLADAGQRGAEMLITEDPGGLYHLSRLAEPLGLKVQGLYELLAQHCSTYWQ